MGMINAVPHTHICPDCVKLNDCYNGKCARPTEDPCGCMEHKAGVR